MPCEAAGSPGTGAYPFPGTNRGPERETTALYENIPDGLLIPPAFLSPRPAFAGEEAQAEAAAQMLTALYGWFTEGFDTPDLQEAKALLEELACSAPPSSASPPSTNTLVPTSLCTRSSAW